MPHLQTLDSRPLTWAELREHHRRYYEMRAITDRVTARAGGECVKRLHSRCNGRMAREEGIASPHDTIPCGCDCHFVTLAQVS